MRPLIPASILFEGTRWSERELIRLAFRWRGTVAAAAPSPLTALVMANHPEAVALLAALTATDAPVVLLPPEPAAWVTSPPLPSGTPLFLIPSLEELGPAAARVGLRPVVMTESHTASSDRASVHTLELRAAGLVFFTSGSAGPPKPVYRTMPAVLAHGTAACDAFRIPRSAGILGMLPLSASHGFSRSLVPAALLGSPLGLLRAFHHRSALATLASSEYRYAAATPLMADVLSRCALSGPSPRMSPVFEVGAGRISDAVSRAFAARFGVPVRPAYGSTECGTITTDTGPPDTIRPAAVGRALSGVEIRIGGDPRIPQPAGVPGRIWARTPWQMAGYGYPPEVRPGPRIEDWSATGDVGFLDDEEYLTLLGRTDECFKTLAGYLVSPLAIVDALVRHPAVRDAIAVPVSTGQGTLIGVLVEGDDRLDPEEVRRHAAQMLPPWSCPHRLIVSAQLPRLPGGKVDRDASRRRLEDGAASGAR